MLRGVAGMPFRRRRRIDATGLAIAAVLIGAVTGVGMAMGEPERVTGLWVGAAISRDGSAQVTEVIDYDFGGRRRRGIYRDVRGLSRDAEVAVSSATAPDDVALLDRGAYTRIRVGDPARTIRGRHRYDVRYGVDDLTSRTRLGWRTVGTGWKVPVDHVEIHVVAPFTLADVRCMVRRGYSERRCDVAHPRPGHLIGRVDAVAPRERIDLFAAVGQNLGDARRLPALPSGALVDTDASAGLLGLAAAAVALLAAAATSRLIRWRGRERVAAGGPPRITGAGGHEALVDVATLAMYAEVTPDPPQELTPATAGVLLAGGVMGEHKVAWLLEAAADGRLDIDVGRNIVLTRNAATDTTRPDPELDRMFGDRERVNLAAYQPRFAQLWTTLGNELEEWRRASGAWDQAGDRRCMGARVLGVTVALAGLVLAAAGGTRAAWGSGLQQVAVVAGAGLVGAGLAAVVRAWELRVRTPLGSALWLRAEGFRRFLADARADQVDDVTRRGRQRSYTAWAVGLGAHDRWCRAVAVATATRATDPTCDRTFVAVMSRAATKATTVPRPPRVRTTRSGDHDGWSGSWRSSDSGDHDSGGWSGSDGSSDSGGDGGGGSW